jgi:tetratricopeptide (TPR) repeat protein
MALGDHQNARRAYEQAIALGVESAQDRRDLGTISELEGDMEAAVIQYERAILLDPQYGDSSYRLGGALERLGDDSRADKSYQRAIALDPDHAAAHYNLARLSLRLGRTEEGTELMATFEELKAYESDLKAKLRAVTRAPRDPQAAYDLGMVYFGRGRLEKAREVFEKIALRHPDFTAAGEKLEEIERLR